MASAIDPTKPVEGVQASKADLRANLAAAKAEIEALQAATVGITPYSQSGMRNRIINGDFRVVQREFGTDTTIAPPQIAYQFDMWTLTLGAGGQSIKTWFRRTDAPVGFTRYIRLESTATSALASNHYHYFQQTIEGTHVRDFMWGTASAKTITVSFWIRANTPGSYTFALLNGAASGSIPTRSFIGYVYVANANVWEYKTYTVTGDGLGSWGNAPAVVGLRLRFDLGSGSNYQAPDGAWIAGEYHKMDTAISLVEGTGRTLDLTGVQVELGTVATPFDYRFDVLETMLCQRYYQKANVILNGVASGVDQNYGVSTMLATEMMTIPTKTLATMAVSEQNIKSASVDGNAAYMNVNWVSNGAGAYVGAREVRSTANLV